VVVSQHFARSLAWPLLGLYGLVIAATFWLVRFGSGASDDEWAVVSYLGLFFLLPKRVLARLTSSSHLAVAGSTLAVAALPCPVRPRIQTAVERRCNRLRYDATGTLDALAVRPRNELDPETVSAGLQRVTHETLQPARMSLCLRGAGQ
jgi:hypothetical protein